MKRFTPVAIALMFLFSCGKKEEPAPETPTPAVTSQEPQAPAGETRAESSTPGSEKAQVGGRTHIVVKGDTLYSIAKKNGLNHRDLASWNNIKDPRSLPVGKELRLTAPEK